MSCTVTCEYYNHNVNRHATRLSAVKAYVKGNFSIGSNFGKLNRSNDIIQMEFSSAFFQKIYLQFTICLLNFT